MVLVDYDCCRCRNIHSVQSKVSELVEQTAAEKAKQQTWEMGGRGMITVKDLTFSYGKGKQALHGLDFTVDDGEIFGFLGPNGSGKSTTQKILTGILTGHGGFVSLFGQEMVSSRTHDFFQKIGVLFEFPYLYANLSAVDNLKYFASFYPKQQARDVFELQQRGAGICV